MNELQQNYQQGTAKVADEPLLAADLRIGNWIKLKSGTETIIRGAGINAIEMQQLIVYPITLTDDWFSQFQYPKEKYGFYRQGDNFSLKLLEGKIIIQTHLDSIITKIKYVHQLQNLYYSLNGTELFLIGG